MLEVRNVLPNALKMPQNTTIGGLKVGSYVGCEMNTKIYLRNLIWLCLHHFYARFLWAIMQGFKMADVFVNNR